MKKSTQIQWAVGVLASAIACNSFAGFQESGSKKIEERITAWSQPAPSAMEGVIQIGTPKESVAKLTAAAKDVSFLTALKMIIPQGGWKAKRAGGVSIDKKVEWSGKDRPWVEVLHEIANKYEYTFVVDWEKQEVTVAPKGWEVADGGSVSVLKVVTPIKVDPKPNNIWTLDSSKTLKENVMNWASQTGWRVSWEAADYPIEDSTVLKGKFEDEEAGPLAQIVRAYQDAKQPFTITFYSNRVIRVENASFKPVQMKDERVNYRAMQ